MTIDQLRNIEVRTVEQGKDLVAAILDEQLELHKQMQNLYDNEKWQKLSDRHFYLRKVRHNILNKTGLLAIKIKQGL